MFSAALFILFFVACTALAFVRNPFYGLALYLGVFFVHPPSRWWGASLPDLRWSFIAGAIAMLAVIVHRRRLDYGARPWYSVGPGSALLVFVVWFWVQNLWALYPSAHFDASVQFTKYVVVFYLVYKLATDPRQSTDILLLHVAGCGLLGAISFYYGRTGGGRLDGVGGPGIDDANSLGMYLATGVVIGGMLLLVARGWRRIALIVVLPIILNGLVLTGSRGAFLGLIAGGMVLVFLCPPRRRLAFWTFAALGAIAALSLVDDKFVDRMFTIKTAIQEREEIDSSAESRLVLLEAQARMAFRYPHGAGFRGTAALSRDYLDETWLYRGGDDPGKWGRTSHNTFMTALVEQGILGGVIYLWLCLWWLRAVARLKVLQKERTAPEATVPAIAACAGLAVLWTAGQFTDYIQAEVQVWLFAALAASIEQLRLATSPAGAVADLPAESRHAVGAGRTI